MESVNTQAQTGAEPTPVAKETGPDAEALTAQLRRAVRQRKRNFNIANTASWISMVTTLLWILSILQQVSQTTNPFSSLYTLSLTGLWFVLISIVFGYTWRGARQVRAAVQTLADQGSVQAVGALLEAMEMGEPLYDFSTLGYSDRPVYGMAAKALTTLLPRLKASDAASLTPHQRTRLHKALEASVFAPTKGRRTWRAFPAFSVAALRALEQIGDRNAEPLVTRIVSDASDPEVRAAAEACLPALRERIVLEQSSTTLLRAAQPSTYTPAAAEVLLRPAHAVNVTEAGELLRASAARTEAETPVLEPLQTAAAPLHLTISLPSETETLPASLTAGNMG